MCGFAGFFDAEESLNEEKYLWMALARRMAQRIAHRGPDGKGAHVSAHCALAHVRLAVMDPENGAQPMTCMDGPFKVTIAYNGEIYNADELRAELSGHGYSFETGCDTEVVLKSYLCFGPACVEKLNGIFAFAVDDTRNERVFLCRDRFGVKPLFYTFSGSRLVFASEIKALFEYPGVRPLLGRTGICEIFGLGPARTPGCGVFENIREILPGHAAVFGRDGFSEYPYFRLEARPFTDDYDTAVQKVRALLEDIVSRQLVSDVPLCTFLSGGLDSSAVTAIAAAQCRDRGLPLHTYSFEYQENARYFAPSDYQPDRDAPWAEKVGALLKTEHHTLLCDNDRLADLLTDAVIAETCPAWPTSTLRCSISAARSKNSTRLPYAANAPMRFLRGTRGSSADIPQGSSPGRRTFPNASGCSGRRSRLKPRSRITSASGTGRRSTPCRCCAGNRRKTGASAR